MTLSPYVQRLRTHLGSSRILLPSVSVHVFDDAGRLLIVEQAETGHWSTPGGAIELGETPADAALREMWEETGLHVELVALAGVFGGDASFVRYANGDETEYVISVFTARVVGGEPRVDGTEVSAWRYASEAECRELPLQSWLRSLLPLVFATRGGNVFQPATWEPPADGGARG